MTRSLVLLGVLLLVQPDRSALVSYFDIADGQVTCVFIIIYIYTFYYFHSFGDRLRIQCHSPKRENYAEELQRDEKCRSL